jgi:hypothetical protein
MKKEQAIAKVGMQVVLPNGKQTIQYLEARKVALFMIKLPFKI